MYRTVIDSKMTSSLICPHPSLTHYRQVEKAGVSFQGSTRTGLAGLLWLRSALKLMEEIASTDHVSTLPSHFSEQSYR